jgi:hypothetical protein
MHATVTTWRLRHPPRDGAEFDRVVRTLMRGGIEVGRRVGVVDIVIIEFEPDTFQVVSLYESLEEAMDSSSHVFRYVEEGWADQIELISRVTGPAYDYGHFTPFDREEAQLWRADADQMYANVSTWHLGPAIRPPDAFAAFVTGALESSLPVMRSLGLLDTVGVRIGPDTLCIVRLCGDATTFESLYTDETMAAAKPLIDGKLALVEQATGRAFDALSIFTQPA